MSSDRDGRRLLLHAVRQAVRRARGRAPLILIDGPSGAGKSRLADALLMRAPAGAGAPARLVRMDDLYPGWHGLDAGSAAVGRTLLRPLRAGATGGWRRWDWGAQRHTAWNVVGGHAPVVVEGCGSMAAANVRLADLTVWLDADEGLRKRRALARDGATFERHWDEWQRQFVRYAARERPRASAGLVLDVSGWSLDGWP